jgi:hypothetical protein
MNALSIIIRVTLTALLLGGVYRETGPVTVTFAALMVLYVELTTILARKDTP